MKIPRSCDLAGDRTGTCSCFKEIDMGEQSPIINEMARYLQGVQDALKLDPHGRWLVKVHVCPDDGAEEEWIHLFVAQQGPVRVGINLWLDGDRVVSGSGTITTQ